MQNLVNFIEIPISIRTIDTLQQQNLDSIQGVCGIMLNLAK